MREKLMALSEQGKPIRVAIIGCGRFGSMMLAQILHAPGMDVAVACDINYKRATDAMVRAGHDPSGLFETDNVLNANTSIEKRVPVITENSDVAIRSVVDVVVEATGNPEIGAKHASDAINFGKHIVMVNVEADVLVGLTLKDMADKAGVVYSLVYGDQPALIEDLYDWAVSMGFDVVAAGKGTKYIPDYRKGTPDDALIRYGYTLEQIESGHLNPKMYNSFLDGTKSAVEMCAVANMTGLKPDVPGRHFPPASVEQIPSILIPEAHGGILTQDGVLEVVSCVYPDGTDVVGSIRWGVYVVITSRSSYLRQCLREYGVPMDKSGTYGVIYRPYHLVGMEAPASIARAQLYKEPTGSPKSYVADVVAVARRDLTPGEELDGEGGYTVYGLLVGADEVTSKKLLPIGLCHGARLVNSVSEEQMLSYSDVEISTESYVHRLRDLHVR